MSLRTAVDALQEQQRVLSLRLRRRAVHSSLQEGPDGDAADTDTETSVHPTDVSSSAAPTAPAAPSEGASVRRARRYSQRTMPWRVWMVWSLVWELLSTPKHARVALPRN